MGYSPQGHKESVMTQQVNHHQHIGQRAHPVDLNLATVAKNLLLNEVTFPSTRGEDFNIQGKGVIFGRWGTQLTP